MNLQSFNIATLYCLTNESIRLFYVNKISTTTILPKITQVTAAEREVGERDKVTPARTLITANTKH